MAKPKKYDKLFDKEIDGVYPNIKERFLETTINEGTRNNYKYILAVAYNMEKMLNKDIYEFSWDELDSLLRTYSNKSLQVVHGNVTCLREYINFCIRAGLVPDMVNYLDGLKGEDDLKVYVDQRAAERKYLTRDELTRLQETLINPRDKLVSELLFCGVRGRNTLEDAYEELINLKVEDCDFTNNAILLTRNDGVIRKLDNLSDYTMKLINDTINQEEYVMNNGLNYNIVTGSEITLKNEIKTINKTPFVLRVTGSTKIDKMTRSNITGIVSKIKLWSDNPYITPTNLWVSGLIHQAKLIQEEKGELQKEDYLWLHERFGITNTDNNTWLSTRRKIKDYL